MPRGLGWIHEDPPKTTVTWEGDTVEVPSDAPIYTRISRRLDLLVEGYAVPGKLDELVDYVYSYAPFPFQDAYRRVRNMFIDLQGTEIPVEAISYSVLAPVIVRALKVFPHADFQVLSDKARAFERIIMALLQAETKGLELARELSEAFWFTFCYFLRLHPKAHQNIPDATLDYWLGSLDVQVTHYENVVNGILIEASAEVPRFGHERAISDLVRRAEERRDDDLAFIGTFDSELNDLGKFLTATKRLHR